MSAIKTLPMVLCMDACIDHLSGLFFLGFFNHWEPAVSSYNNKQCNLRRNWPIYCYDKYYVWKRWDKNFEGPQNLILKSNDAVIKPGKGDTFTWPLNRLWNCECVWKSKQNWKVERRKRRDLQFQGILKLQNWNQIERFVVGVGLVILWILQIC